MKLWLAGMANQEHLNILMKGVEAWNAWRRQHPEIGFLNRVRLNGANLHNAALFGVNLSHANLTSADLNRAYLGKADLSGAMLSGATLQGAMLSSAQLNNANLSQAKLADADLQHSDFSHANLIEADLNRATLVSASLYEAMLRWADFSGANLNNADLRSADLASANLKNADLRRANLDGASLKFASLTHTKVGLTVFGNLDLSHLEGLDTAEHEGPSAIGIDTIYRSQGKIPETFLRGAGVPENFIAYMKSLTGAAFEFYSCFISSSTKDQDFADRLHADFQARGVRCWFAPHDIQGGRKIYEQIDEAIRVYDKLLLVLSDSSMNSNWVKTEIANARAREEQQKRQMLFPITLVPFERVRDWKCFDAEAGIDSAREIREYFIPNF